MNTFPVNLHKHQVKTVKAFFKPVNAGRDCTKDNRVIITHMLPSISDDNRWDITVKRLVHNIVYESLSLQSVYLPDRVIPTYEGIPFLVSFTKENQITFSEDPEGKKIPDMDHWFLPSKYLIDPDIIPAMIKGLKVLDNSLSVELSFIGDKVSIYQNNHIKGSSISFEFENLAYNYPEVFSHLFTPSFLIHIFECLKTSALIEIGLVSPVMPEGRDPEFVYIPWSFCGYTTTNGKPLSYRAMIAPRVPEE